MLFLMGDNSVKDLKAITVPLINQHSFPSHSRLDHSGMTNLQDDAKNWAIGPMSHKVPLYSC